jgi:hypothetical protein
MSRNGNVSRRWMGTALCLTMFALGASNAFAGQLYQAGQIVTNDFTLYARLPLTNLAGRVFSPGSPVHLTDFAGYVVFCEFFDPT